MVQPLILKIKAMGRLRSKYQTFKVQINTKKSKAKIKLNPKTVSDQNQDKNGSFNSDFDSQGDWA